MSSGTIVASKEVLSSEIRGEVVLLDLKTENYFGLAGVASRVWQLISRGTSLREMSTILAAEYDVSEEKLAGDLERFVGDLAQAGLVTTDGASVSSSTP
jgi:hypothetical protein